MCACAKQIANSVYESFVAILSPQRRKKLCGDCFDTRRQARQFPRNRILVKDAFGDSAMQFRLCGMKRFQGGLLVTRRDGFFDPPQIGAHAGPARLVDGGAAFNFANHFLCGGRISHVSIT